MLEAGTETWLTFLPDIFFSSIEVTKIYIKNRFTKYFQTDFKFETNIATVYDIFEIVNDFNQYFTVIYFYWIICIINKGYKVTILPFTCLPKSTRVVEYTDSISAEW